MSSPSPLLFLLPTRFVLTRLLAAFVMLLLVSCLVAPITARADSLDIPFSGYGISFGNSRGFTDFGVGGLSFGTGALTRILGTQNGVTIGIFNYAAHLNGVQIGVLNYAGNNPRGLKLTPVFNAHFD
ncbi:MAG: hypothetical protein ABIF77_13535 [bacterium]